MHTALLEKVATVRLRAVTCSLAHGRGAMIGRFELERVGCGHAAHHQAGDTQDHCGLLVLGRVAWDLGWWWSWLRMRIGGHLIPTIGISTGHSGYHEEVFGQAGALDVNLVVYSRP